MKVCQGIYCPRTALAVVWYLDVHIVIMANVRRVSNRLSTVESSDILSAMQGYETPNEVVKALEEGVASGNFKDCANLKYALGPDSFAVIQFYFPVCQKACFVSRDHLYQTMGCPQDCRLYVNRQTAVTAENAILLKHKQEQKRKQRWQKVGHLLADPFQWFAKLSGIAQGMIILLIIIYFSPRIAEAIVKVIHALK